MAASLFILSASIAEARSCTDELNACMKIYNVTRGKQGPVDLIATCRNDFNGCMQTGTWAGRTVTSKGLEKKVGAATSRC